MHTSEKLFECDDNQCRKKFKTVKDLTRHVKRDVHHIDSFSCDLCTKTFKTKGYVAKHMQSLHEGKLYFCASCGTGLKKKDKLKLHYARCKEKQLKNLENEIQMQSEDLELNCFNFQDLFEEFVGLPTKTFYCELCQFDFKTANRLKVHKYQFHCSENERTCSFCKALCHSRDSSCVLRHMRTR